MLVLTIASVSSAQNVNIPDAIFKNALINVGVDTDEDGEINYDEAEAVTSLDVSGMRICDKHTCWNVGFIESLAGIEAFVNLTDLDCSRNQLTSLDVSDNTSLMYLYCSQNQLTSLDVSGCNALTRLYCWVNQLTSLNVSNNTALLYLKCSYNNLSGIDISNNINLEYLYIAGNQLTILDISNNQGILRWKGPPPDIYLDISDMPSLTEVCVWNDFSFNRNYTFNSDYIGTSGSPNVCFETDCNGVCYPTIIEEYKKELLSIFPNPSNDIINIEIENPNNATIEIYNVSGRLVFSKELNSKAEKIDISVLSEGMYFVKVKQENNVRIEKLIVY